MRYMRAVRLSIGLFARAVVASSVMPAFAAPGPVADTRFGIAEGFRNPSVMTDIGAGWERLILPWDQIQPDKPGDFSKLGQTLTRAQIQAELNRGTKVAGLFQFTPTCAPTNPNARNPPVPKTLAPPFHHP